MRLLFLADMFPPLLGGSAAVYSNICRELTGEVEVVASKPRCGSGVPGFAEEDRRQPFPVHRVEELRTAPRALLPVLGSPWNLLTRELPLRRRIRTQLADFVAQIGPDIVCLDQLNAFSWIGLWMQRRFDLPVMHYVHGEELTLPVMSRMYSREVSRALRRADGFVVVSEFTRRELAARGVSQSRIHLVPNGVDVRRFMPGTKNEALLSSHGLKGRKVLLTVSRIEQRKGHDTVLAALPRIAAAVPDVAYLVVGDGTYVPVLRELTTKLHLESHVVFAGAVPDDELPDYYRSCDVFIMPNRTLPDGDTEGFGLVFLEAAACGRPVIGGNAGGVRDAVADGVNGLLVDGTEPDAVADAALRLLTHPTLAREFGQAGVQHASTFSWQRRGRQFRAACEAVLAAAHRS